MGSPTGLVTKNHQTSAPRDRDREAGLLERPRGGHRGERVLAAKEGARTLGIRVDDEGFGQQGSVVRWGRTDHEQADRQESIARLRTRNPNMCTHFDVKSGKRKTPLYLAIA